MEQGMLDLDFGSSAVSTLKDTVFIAFDFETTGLYPGRDRIVEFGAVKFRGTEEIDKFEALVNPGMEIHPDAAKVSGIDNEMVKDKPALESVIPQFVEFLKDAVLIAHNAEFDYKFLAKQLERQDLGELKNTVLDTIPIARAALNGQKSYALQKLAEYLGIRVDAAHRALDDSRVCMELFQYCTRKIGLSLSLKDFIKKTKSRIEV
jgi:DNA polymerase-3 subunit epsilon